MNRILTQKEWQQSVADTWVSVIEATYKDLIEKAVLEEREACAQLLDEMAARDKLSNYYAVAAKAIRARGNNDSMPLFDDWNKDWK